MTDTRTRYQRRRDRNLAKGLTCDGKVRKPLDKPLTPESAYQKAIKLGLALDAIALDAVRAVFRARYERQRASRWGAGLTVAGTARQRARRGLSAKELGKAGYMREWRKLRRGIEHERKAA